MITLIVEKERIQKFWEIISARYYKDLLPLGKNLAFLIINKTLFRFGNIMNEAISCFYKKLNFIWLLDIIPTIKDIGNPRLTANIEWKCYHLICWYLWLLDKILNGRICFTNCPTWVSGHNWRSNIVYKIFFKNWWKKAIMARLLLSVKVWISCEK